MADLVMQFPHLLKQWVTENCFSRTILGHIKPRNLPFQHILGSCGSAVHSPLQHAVLALEKGK